MVSRLAHELRQPLSAMESLSCYLEIVLPTEDTKSRSQVTKMQELLQQTNWILCDAIHYLRAANSHPVVMDWNETLMEVVADGDATVGTDVTFSLDDSIPPVSFDLNQARHLALGMFLFLRKISRGGSTVDIASKLLAESIELEFSAAAPGTRIECDERLFEPFSPQAPAGSGLALASARQIVHAHRGPIGIRIHPVDLVVITVRFPIQSRSQSHISEPT